MKCYHLTIWELIYSELPTKFIGCMSEWNGKLAGGLSQGSLQ